MTSLATNDPGIRPFLEHGLSLFEIFMRQHHLEWAPDVTFGQKITTAGQVFSGTVDDTSAPRT